MTGEKDALLSLAETAAQVADCSRLKLPPPAGNARSPMVERRVNGTYDIGLQFNNLC